MMRLLFCADDKVDDGGFGDDHGGDAQPPCDGDRVESARASAGDDDGIPRVNTLVEGDLLDVTVVVIRDVPDLQATSFSSPGFSSG